MLSIPIGFSLNSLIVYETQTKKKVNSGTLDLFDAHYSCSLGKSIEVENQLTLKSPYITNQNPIIQSSRP